MRCILFCLALLASAIARADDWTAGDTARQAAITSLLIADWAQTRWIVKHEQIASTATVTVTTVTGGVPTGSTSQSIATNYPGYHETNRLLGNDPSIGRVNNFFALSIGLNVLVATQLPAGAYRQTWQYGWIVYEAYFVLKNRSIGIGMSF